MRTAAVALVLVSVPFLGDLARAEDADIARWIELLASPRYEERERGTNRLIEAGPPALVQAARGGDLETAWRSMQAVMGLYESEAEEEFLAARTAMALISEDESAPAARLARRVIADELARFTAAGGRFEVSDKGDLVLLHLEQRPIRDRDLKVLLFHDQVERLYLALTPVTDGGLAYLKNLSNLQRMSLWRTSISDAGLAHLAELDQLAVLDIHGTMVTDGGLLHLADLIHLKYLNISQCRGIHGEGLAALAELELTTLDVRQTRITDEHLQDFREDHPGCRILR